MTVSIITSFHRYILLFILAFLIMISIMSNVLVNYYILVEVVIIPRAEEKKLWEKK